MKGIVVTEGKSEKDTELYQRLTTKRMRKAMGLGSAPELSLARLTGSHSVFLLRDHVYEKQFVLKSFCDAHTPRAESLRRLDKEYARLKLLRRLVTGRSPWPVCRDRKALFFIEEHVGGQHLEHYVVEALTKGGGGLHDNLDLVAEFLFDLHSRTALKTRGNVPKIRFELTRHAAQSRRAGSIDRHTQRELVRLTRTWCKSAGIRGAHASLTHGDATVSNFLFRNRQIFAIDLECSRYRDPVYDLGMLAGELFGQALLHTGNPYRADPYIDHMYRAYAGFFHEPLLVFQRLTARNPLYMANSLLRMSRNAYLSQQHRQNLAMYAMKCLQSSPPG